MKRILPIILSLIISVAAMASLACASDSAEAIVPGIVNYKLSAPREAVPVNKLSFDFTGGEDVMPIGGFFGPYISHTPVVNGQNLPDYLTEEMFERIAGSGVNNILFYNTYTESFTDKMLELGSKTGVGVFVRDSYIESLVDRNTTYKKGDYFDNEKFSNRVAELSKHDSFLGIHVYDEPFTYQFDGIQKVCEEFYKLGYDNKIPNFNFLSYNESSNVYTGYQELMSGDDYFSQLVEISNIKFLSSTAYPFVSAKDNPEKNLVQIFHRMATFRKLAERYGIVWWRMLQAGGQWNDAAVWMPSVDPYPSEGEMLWDINVSLAYGAKSIQYFPLIQPEWFARAENNTYDFQRNGLIGADGNCTQWYYYAQKAAKQIQAIDYILMNAANMGVIASGDDAERIVGTGASARDEVITEGSFRELIRVDGDALVGCFDYRGRTSLYVVNFSRTEKSKITLRFDDKYGLDVIQRGQSSAVAGKNVILNLEKGEGALVTLR